MREARPRRPAARAGTTAAAHEGREPPGAARLLEVAARAAAAPAVQRLAALQRLATSAVTLQAKWVDAGDGLQRWDALRAGLRWYYDDGSGLMHYRVEAASRLPSADRDRLLAAQGRAFTYASWQAAGWREGVDDAAPREPVPAVAVERAVPADAARLIEQFNTGGLLVRTVQARHALEEFENITVSVEEALKLHAAGQHSGLRKWTLAHGDLLANFYKMGPDTTAMARYIGILADPSAVGDRFVGFHEKDAFSGNLQEGTELIPQAEASARLDQLLQTLEAKQTETSAALENNEVQTLGFAASAVRALLYKPGGDIGSPKSWPAARPTFQKLVDGMARLLGAQMPAGGIHVFTYEQHGKSTELVFLETLRPAG